MRNINILAIAPYPGLKDVFINCAKGFPNLSLEVLSGNLQVALQNLKDLQDREFDIIISRGGTAKMLKDSLQTPVLEVEVSVYDMLRVIKTAQQTGKKFAIMGFSNITRASTIICDILKFEIPIFEIGSEEEAYKHLDQMSQDNIDLVIGDVITTDVARQAGMNNLLITSGPESVEKVLLDSIAMYHYISRTRRGELPFRAIIDCFKTLHFGL